MVNNSHMKRRDPYLELWQELSREKSMVFMAGPRQVGKTTLAHIIAKSYTNHLYFNWDIPDHKRLLLEDPAFFSAMDRKDLATPLVVFDEIHKYKDWKNYLKGVYDQFHALFRFLVSGSGRLDIYQKGGDSLAGRYFLFHLWPFTLSELAGENMPFDDFLANPLQIRVESRPKKEELWLSLWSLSGFPEPFVSGRKRTYKRWSNTYSQQLIREDIRDLTGIKSISGIEMLYLLLPSRVGSPLSIPSLSRDIKVSYNTIQNWLTLFERFFLTFVITPWTQKITRAIQKEKKVYIWDTPRIEDDAARFENMVAIELYRAVTGWNDMGYGLFSLHFIRNKEKQEVDFLIVKDRQPFLLVEAKLTEAEPSSALKKFQAYLQIPGVQLIFRGDTFRLFPNGEQSILVAPAPLWLSGLP